MTWHAQLQLDYALESGRTVARHAHSGPLRVLRSLYPQGAGVCHNVLVHPPGGLVGGDTLDIRVSARAGTHALITTPGATRVYRSDGQPALQHSHLSVHAGARLEWLPLEMLCYNACMAENRLILELEPGAELLGWDVTALGLPHAGQVFSQGYLSQHLEVPGVWLERGTLAAEDVRLLDSPLGLAGQRCMALAFFVCGSALDRPRRQIALDSARAALNGHALAALAGVTSPHPQIVVARILAPVVEPAMLLLRTLRAAWQEHLWGMQATLPRIWAM